MKLSRRIALGNAQMDAVDASVVIRSFDPGSPQKNTQVTPLGGHYGSRITGKHWNMIEATVTYAINISKDVVARRAVYDAVCEWARSGGWLTSNILPGKRLYAQDVEIESMGDPRDWNKEFRIVFRGYGVPFWQDSTGTTMVTENISSGDLTVTVGGMVETPLDVSFKNTSGSSCANISFSINGNTLTFTGINLAAGSTLAITHGTDGLLKAMVGSTSKYGIMTGGDDLWANPGNNTLTISASGAGELTITSYGRYI